MFKPCEIKILANAKLNLSLDITGVREDGYHLMDMVNRSVDLCDELTISTARAGGIEIRSNSKYMPRDERNHVYKAVLRLQEYLKTEFPGLEIYIKKRIPTQAGLGGGSADAAAALVGLNELLGLSLTKDTLCAIGEKIGADVPFCVVGGAARVTGIGEIVETVNDNGDYCVVIIMPNGGRSTREAFAAIDGKSSFARPDTDGMVACLEKGDVSGMSIKLCNVFHTVEKTEDNERLMSLLLGGGALGVSMTGSGAAVFGIFSNHLDARECCAAVRRNKLRCFVSRPAEAGTCIIGKK